MEHRTFLDALDAQKDAQDFLLATVLEGQQQGTALLLCDGQVAWTSAPETLLTQNLSALKKCTTSGVFTLGDTRVFAERFGAGARLVICGGGHVAAAAARLAKLLDLPVTGLEDRPEYADALRETGADRVLCAPFETSLAQIPGSTETYFCVLTRAHAYDITCLKQILQKPAAYVGMMGSRGRSELVRRQLAEAGLDPARVARLHAPIGLAIGAKTAQEIALASEIIVEGTLNVFAHPTNVNMDNRIIVIDRAVHFGADRGDQKPSPADRGVYAGNPGSLGTVPSGANGCCAGNHRFPPRLHAPRGGHQDAHSPGWQYGGQRGRRHHGIPCPAAGRKNAGRYGSSAAAGVVYHGTGRR